MSDHEGAGDARRGRAGKRSALHRAPLAGAHVLVVDDSRINQLVARALLEGWGVIVETANHGGEAVDMIRRAPGRFDAILMDVEMPEMDGCEATRVIRREWPERALPIIAVTADALGPGTRAYLDAGMNDYVSKPVDPDRLDAVLQKWVKRHAGAGSDHVGLEGIDVDAALARLNGKRDVLARLLRTFVDEHEHAAEAIGHAIRDGDLASALKVTHTLKGVAGNLSATAVLDAARVLDDHLRRGDGSDSRPHVERLATALEVVRQSVATWRGQGAPDREPLSPSPQGVPPPAADTSLLVELDRLLKDHRVSARAQFELVRERLINAGPRGPIEDIQACLDRLDFEGARRLLPDLARQPGLAGERGGSTTSLARPSILIVDDAPANLEALFAVLGTGYELIFAMSGQEAVDRARDQSPDLILLDVVMPGMNGHDACRQLKSEAATSGIPVIFVTSMDNEEDEAAGLDVGAIDYLTKPIRASIVKARIRNHLELKRARDVLEGLSMTDALTGLPNRRQFDVMLDSEVRRALRNRQPLGLLMCDIDHFKGYNDRYGHQAGDRCLQEVAAVLRETFRRGGELPARYGGEEFAVILPGVPPAEALLMGERVRAAVEARRLQYDGAATAPWVTMSVGAASLLVTAGVSAGRLIQLADHALYASKQGGRNRTTCADSAPDPDSAPADGAD